MLNIARKRCCCCTYFDAIYQSPAAGQSLLSAALGTTLVVESGTWDITGAGRLRVTGPGRIRIDVPQPDGAPMMTMNVSNNITAGGSADLNHDNKLRLYLDYTDPTNCHYVEGCMNSAFTIGFTPVNFFGKIAKVDGGSETVLANATINWYNIGGALAGSNYVGGTFCIQNTAVAVTTIPTAGSRAPIAEPTTPDGGLKAAIEVDQGATDVFTLDQITLSKATDPACPHPPVCPACHAAPGCQAIPAAGFLATISGLADGSTGSYCVDPEGFHGSFTCDELAYAFSGAVGWRSAIFTLSPPISCLSGPTAYDRGRIYLIPNGSPCSPSFDVQFYAIQSGNLPAGENIGAFWRNVGRVSAPVTITGSDVDGDCTALAGMEESDFSNATDMDISGLLVEIDAL